MNLKFKNYILNYVKNKNSDYPLVKGGKYGDIKLKDIYDFLLSGKDSQIIKNAKIYRKNYRA